MTFIGSGHDDVQQILKKFPRSFTTQDVANHFGWSSQRVRQAMVAGQQTDLIRMLFDAHPSSTGRVHAIYEHGAWRKKWITKAWRAENAGSVMGSGQQGESGSVLSVCEGAGGRKYPPYLSDQVRQSVEQTIQRASLDVS